MSTTPGGARRALPSRPTTPLRPLSRSSLRASSSHRIGGNGSRGGDIETDVSGTGVYPLETMLEPQFADLADGMADLEANLIHLQLQHESLARFAESFASFLYGMQVNAFCVDFPEVSAVSHYWPTFKFPYCAVVGRSLHVLKRFRLQYQSPSVAREALRTKQVQMQHIHLMIMTQMQHFCRSYYVDIPLRCLRRLSKPSLIGQLTPLSWRIHLCRQNHHLAILPQGNPHPEVSDMDRT